MCRSQGPNHKLLYTGFYKNRYSMSANGSKKAHSTSLSTNNTDTGCSKTLPLALNCTHYATTALTAYCCCRTADPARIGISLGWWNLQDGPNLHSRVL